MKVQFHHVYSHSKVWLNEVADEIINHSRLGATRLDLRPGNKIRLPRYLQVTKQEVKLLYERDEDLFWEVLTKDHDSLSGHIRSVFGLSKGKIKQIQKMLAGKNRHRPPSTK